MNYVSVSGTKWTLSAVGRRYFGPQAVESYEAFVEYAVHQWKFIENLDEVLRTGKGIDFHAHQTSADWSAYQRGMLESAKGFAWFVAKHTPVPEGASSCLDLAGSHGYVGGLLCQKHPPMRSTVLDRPEALATARTLGQGEPWFSMVSFREGNLLTDDLGKGYDVVLSANILHHFPAEANRGILRRVRAAMKPGGIVSIFEIEPPHEGQAADAGGDGFALYFRITSDSSCFRGADYVSWLSAAGFASPRVIRSWKMPSRMLVVAKA